METSLAPSMSAEESHLLVAQVITTSVTSIKDQLAQMNEVIMKLTRIVEENDV